MEQLHGAVVNVVSNNPGAGATTLKKNLSREYGLVALSAGDFRTTLVFDYERQKKSWAHFRRSYISLWERGGIQSVIDHLSDSLSSASQVGNGGLVRFNDRASKDYAPFADDWKIWDWMTDAYTLNRIRTLLQDGKSVVGEGDLIIAIHAVDQVKEEAQKLAEEFPTLPHTTFNYLLHVTPTVAAKRIEEREKQLSGENYRPLSLEARLQQIQALQRDDYDRYSNIYTLEGIPLSIAEYNARNAKEVSTMNNTAQKVEAIVVSDICEKLSTLGETHPELSAHVLKHFSK